MSLGPYNKPGSFIETQGIKRVLIIKLTSLGDVVHALPVASSLKKSYPYLHLHWIVEDRCAPLLENQPLLESVIIYPRQEIQGLFRQGKWVQAFNKVLALRRSLRDLKIDLSIDLQGLAKSGLMALLAWAPYRIGWPGLKEMSSLISRRIPGATGLHVVDSHLRVAEFLGASTEAPEFVLGITEEERSWAKEFLRKRGLAEGRRLLGLQMGTASPPKSWPLPAYWAFIEQVSALPDLQVILFGDQSDRERLNPYLNRIPEKAINTIGELSLRQLMALTAQCRIFVGGDSGPLHLAVGLGLPVVGLYGGTDPGWAGPYGNSHRIHYKRFPCSPCLLTPDHKPPLCQGRGDCMEAIEVEEVISSVQSILRNILRVS